MSLTSPIFIFLCLPVMMALYAFIPQGAKRHAISVFGVIFYIVANIKNPFAVVMLTATVLIVYFSARAIDRRAGKRRQTLGTAVAAAIGAVFAAVCIAKPFGLNCPFGAPIWLLASISCVTDVKRGDAPPPSIFDAVFYISYFPVMAVGPIVKYRDSIEIYREADFSFSNLARGAEFFMIGYIKRFALASVLFEMLNVMYSNIGAGIGVLSVIEYIVILPVIAYCFFSGYSDMAIGISSMFGYSLKRDFCAPFKPSTPLEYFEGFFSSLYDFASDYLGRAVGRASGKRGGKFATYLIVFLAVALWFDGELLTLLVISPFAVALAYFAARPKRAGRVGAKKALTTWLCRGATFVAVALFWGFILAESAPDALKFGMDFVLHLGGFKSLLVFGGVSLAKYVITSALAFLTLSLLDRESFDENAPVRVIKNVILIATFVFTLIFWFPQFPQSVAIFF